LTPQLVGSSVE